MYTSAKNMINMVGVGMFSTSAVIIVALSPRPTTRDGEEWQTEREREPVDCFNHNVHTAITGDFFYRVLPLSVHSCAQVLSSPSPFEVDHRRLWCHPPPPLTPQPPQQHTSSSLGSEAPTRVHHTDDLTTTGMYPVILEDRLNMPRRHAKERTLFNAVSISGRPIGVSQWPIPIFREQNGRYANKDFFLFSFIWSNITIW